MSSLKFNPLFCESYKNFSLCKDSENGSCEYDTEDSFNNMLAVNQIRLNLKCMQLSWNWPFPPYEHSSYI